MSAAEQKTLDRPDVTRSFERGRQDLVTIGVVDWQGATGYGR